MEITKELERRAERESRQHKARLRERYNYARSLGFTSPEAKIMSGWSKERIDLWFSSSRKKEPKKVIPKRE